MKKKQKEVKADLDIPTTSKCKFCNKKVNKKTRGHKFKDGTVACQLCYSIYKNSLNK